LNLKTYKTNSGGIGTSINTKEFVLGFWDAWNSHNWEKTSPYYADNCVMEDLPSRICHGKKELETYYNDLLAGYPDLNFEAKNCFSRGNRIASEWIMSGTHIGNTPRFKATGKRFSVPGISSIEIQDGKIIRETDYWDMYSLLKQLGIVT
jgi:steroid delta-isomerase-like uncharacterized protein